jgi:hypothetical protein
MTLDEYKRVLEQLNLNPASGDWVFRPSKLPVLAGGRGDPAPVAKLLRLAAAGLTAEQLEAL